MRIRITVDDEYLRKWWNIRKGGVYLVQEILYANKTNKKKRYVKGYRIRGKVVSPDAPNKEKFPNIIIRLNECEVVGRKPNPSQK